MRLVFDGDLQRNKEVLDQYDFLPYLEIYDDVDQLMFTFEYECDLSKLPNDFEKCPFNYMTTEDFVNYLQERYPLYNIYEVTKYKIQKRDIKL